LEGGAGKEIGLITTEHTELQKKVMGTLFLLSIEYRRLSRKDKAAGA
jgi:hypothetical protein